MSDGGYIRVYRATLDHPLFVGRPDRLGAWVWLLMRAAWKETRQDVNGRTVVIHRGEMSVSFREMAKAWGWSIGAVQRFVARLKTDTMIDTATDTGRMVITICNYDIYQSSRSAPDTPNDTSSDTRPIRDRYTKERREEGKKSKRGARKRASRLPEDWVLPKAWGEWALANTHLSPEQIREEAEKMSRWSRASPKGACLDWYARWQNWVKDAHPKTPPKGPTGGQSDDRLARKIARFSAGSENSTADGDREAGGDGRDPEGNLLPLRAVGSGG